MANFKNTQNHELKMALLHKPIAKDLFHNIIFTWISLNLKFTVLSIDLHITERSLIVEILPFGLIQKLSDTRKQMVNKVEIKLILMKLSNAA